LISAAFLEVIAFAAAVASSITTCSAYFA